MQVKFTIVDEHISLDVPANDEFKLVMMKNDFKVFNIKTDASNLDGSI